jgi:hypothetical protein
MTGIKAKRADDRQASNTAIILYLCGGWTEPDDQRYGEASLHTLGYTKI